MGRKIIPLLIIFLLSGLFPASCLADATSSTAILTVDQAVEMAKEKRNDVQVAWLDLQAAGVSTDLAWDSAADAEAAAHIPGTNYFADLGYDPYLQVYNAEFNEKSKQKAYNLKLDSLEFSVYQRYYAVVSALDNADAQKLASQQAEEKLRIAKLRTQLGMDTRFSFFQAETQAAAASSAWANAQQGLDQKYIDLMEFIGMSASSRPELVRELTYEPVTLMNPEAKFQDIVNASPSVWLANESVQLLLDTAGNSGSDDLEYINEQKADINVITTKESMLQVTRNIYYSLKTIEDSYAAAEEGIRTANEALRIAKLMYDLGMGTKLDITAAEMAANTAQQTLDGMSYQHAILAKALEKPWAYGAAN